MNDITVELQKELAQYKELYLREVGEKIKYRDLCKQLTTTIEVLSALEQIKKECGV